MSKVETKVHYTGSDDQFIIERVQDVESVLERNKALYNHNDGYSDTKDMKAGRFYPVGGG